MKSKLKISICTTMVLLRLAIVKRKELVYYAEESQKISPAYRKLSGTESLFVLLD